MSTTRKPLLHLWRDIAFSMIENALNGVTDSDERRRVIKEDLSPKFRATKPGGRRQGAKLGVEWAVQEGVITEEEADPLLKMLE